jgi:hypothetical protein
VPRRPPASPPTTADLFGRLGVHERSARQADIGAALSAWAQFGGPSPAGAGPPGTAVPATRCGHDGAGYDGGDYDGDDDESELMVVPPGVSPFTGQLIADAEPRYGEAAPGEAAYGGSTYGGSAYGGPAYGGSAYGEYGATPFAGPDLRADPRTIRTRRPANRRRPTTSTTRFRRWPASG